MYEKVFNLNSRPFTSAPYVKHYFPGESIHTALRQVRMCIDRSSGPAVVIGGTGNGKTLLLAMLEQQYFQQMTVVNLACAKMGERQELLQSILFELGLPFRDMSEAELRLSLIEYLKSEERCPTGVLLLIDEAHTLPAGALDEVQLMTNFVRNGEPQVRLVLVGNHGLEDHLVDTRLDSLNQRIAVRCFIDTLSSAETKKYIETHISRAGGDASKLFTEQAIDSIHSRSSGCPRLINQICDQAMIVAVSVGSNQVTDEIAEQAWSDIQCVPGNMTYNSAGSDEQWATHETEDSSIEISTQLGSEFNQSVITPQEPIHTPPAFDFDDQDESETPDEVLIGPSSEEDATENEDDSWTVFEVGPAAAAATAGAIGASSLGMIQGVTPEAEEPSPEIEETPQAESSDSELEPFVNPFDETFVQEEEIVNEFVSEVAEHNLTSLNVSADQLNVLDQIAEQLEAQQAADQTQQLSEVVVSDDKDLRLNPSELQQVEAIEKEIQRIEASQENAAEESQKVEQFIQPMPQSIQMPIQPTRNIEAIDDVPETPEVQLPTAKSSLRLIPATEAQGLKIQPITDPATPDIPLEYPLAEKSEDDDSPSDDKDMLIVSRSEQYMNNQTEEVGQPIDPSIPSMPSTGSVARMDYSKLFEQLRKND